MPAKVGDKIRILDYGHGQFNGLEGEITEVAPDNAETPYKFSGEVWPEREDLKIVGGKIYRRARLPLREGEFEIINKEK